MAVLDKVFFWKKDSPDIEALADKELNGSHPDPFGLDKPIPGLEEVPVASGGPTTLPGTSADLSSSPLPPHLASSDSGSRNVDLELINSKLDTIKAILSSLEHRMAGLEKAAGTEQKQRLW